MVNINELEDKNIIILTKNKITILNRDKENNYIIKEEYPIKENWKIVPEFFLNKKYEGFNQYYSTTILKNNKLLLNSFSIEIEYRHCGTQAPEELSFSKIFFIDLKNFEEINSTEKFETHATYVLLENLIIIKGLEKCYIYDINSFNLIKNIKLEDTKCLYKYDNNYLITLSKYEIVNIIKIYKIQNNDLINYKEFEVKLYHYIKPPRKRLIIESLFYKDNKCLLVLKNKKIIIYCHEKLNLLQLIIE